MWNGIAWVPNGSSGGDKDGAATVPRPIPIKLPGTPRLDRVRSPSADPNGHTLFLELVPDVLEPLVV